MQQTRKPDFYFKGPVEAHVVKKNNRPIHGRGEKKWIGKSPRLKAAEERMHIEFQSFANRIRFNGPLRGDIHARFIFYFVDFFTVKNKRSRSLPDLSNLLELPADCLQTAGIIENDTDIISFNGSMRAPGKINEIEISLWVIPEFGHVPLEP